VRNPSNIIMFWCFCISYVTVKSSPHKGWAGLGWAGLGWAGLGWAGLGWAGLGWAGLGWAYIRCSFGHTNVDLS
jgi:hypothetical protein